MPIQRQLKCCEVTVADNPLRARTFGNHGEVFEETHAAVPAACRDDGASVWVGKGVSEIIETPFVRRRQIPVWGRHLLGAVADAYVVHLPQHIETARIPIRVAWRTGGGEHDHGVAGAERRRDHGGRSEMVRGRDGRQRADGDRSSGSAYSQLFRRK
jgi:hypothetical protein